MKFENCFTGLDLDKDKRKIIDSCLQALSQDLDEFEGLLDDMSKNESSGFDLACIYLDSNFDDSYCPEFEGVCFNYLDEYAVVTRSEAQQVLSRCISMLSMEYVWHSLSN